MLQCFGHVVPLLGDHGLHANHDLVKEVGSVLASVILRDIISAFKEFYSNAELIIMHLGSTDIPSVRQRGYK